MKRRKKAASTWKDLPQAEQELTPEEAREVQGGLIAGTYGRGTFQVSLDVPDVNNDSKGEIITGGPGAAAHVK